ncbi:putative ABC transport system ATP-binding protein [Hymenobacter luteus]|uniref:ABC transport system ATP-binding protein n=2 Tax=Hymenobacter TaxID=89966 RepID=A0ABR6JX85_9BACT|nr:MULTISPECIES: ABC transporter ATP-binding protein [Hymenobacter]MBB4601434.1 putative ABC transport system ATP-binding protein [Hymenobacter latericoloratus]MBB6058359.1 putative ABC transport system ATP-binding protein [Hymenobacter luteus]
MENILAQSAVRLQTNGAPLATASQPVIQLRDIEKVYQTKTIETVALNRVNLTINKGEFVSIMGPSGCGKSTLLSIMGLLDEPTSGVIELDGRPVQSYSDKELAALRNHKIGFVFQSYHLINDLTVLDNVELPLLYRPGVGGKERRERAYAALDKVGLSARTNHFPSQLSGGQRQRVAIARALAGRPEIILADEPTGNLDSVMGEEIMDLLLGLNREDGTTIVMVTHDEQQARRTERLIRFFDGSQVQ